jgi:hypothetical protein
MHTNVAFKKIKKMWITFFTGIKQLSCRMQDAGVWYCGDTPVTVYFARRGALVALGL